MKFADINVAVGLPMLESIFTPVVARQELLSAMDAAGEEKALIWHYAQKDGSPMAGNEKVEEFVGAEERLFGCYALLPPQTGETPTDGLFQQMRDTRARALRLFPESHRYILDRVSFGDVLDEATTRRIPVLISLTHDFDWRAVYALLADFPNLTCVVCDIGSWSQDRYLYPLLNRYERLSVETSMLALEDGGVEAAVSRFGAQRLVFGSGFPERYTEAPMLQLIHADVSDSDRELIAGGNFDRLMQEVVI